ncbi:hypothetical protein Sgly_1238 [Syntrophobotulus glycolicus DSM 8271]|uniref:Uncharacterized protein n=1 Tax=Syntrophobotulus glycolicus (strain DSM 8271 / FlGlyR) TaxID=645991 RepID=F0SV54_SYNGF|nr:hypothetical protein [Syntrophobotulus glycolicus]ADY55554.1 hypothetical protein Sgly_1238 [Syntrophobotulus glycolicus DSM 8271]
MKWTLLDSFFYNVFRSMGVYLVSINVILGVALIVAGALMNKSLSKNKKTAGTVCIGIGILTIISAVAQMIL